MLDHKRSKIIDFGSGLCWVLSPLLSFPFEAMRLSNTQVLQLSIVGIYSQAVSHGASLALIAGVTQDPPIIPYPASYSRLGYPKSCTSTPAVRSASDETSRICGLACCRMCGIPISARISAGLTFREPSRSSRSARYMPLVGLFS
jgi:hypothetical protein